VGAPAITTCGMKEEEASEVAELISRTVKEDSDKARSEVAARVTDLTSRFRPYPDVA
jgi:glycine/serine hydroxymethyltransferase